MRVGIFDPYLNDLGGGEKYMMTIAAYLSKKHSVSVFWEKEEDLKKIAERFSLDLSKVNLVKNIFSQNTSFLERLKESIKYDAIILLSDGSLPFLLSKKTYVHFQQPIPCVTPNAVNLLKLKRINKIFCNSKFTKSFIDKEFNIDSYVLYPPVEDITGKNSKENIILTVGRLRVNKIKDTDFKKHSVLIETFKKLIDKGLADWKFVLAVSVNKEDEDYLEKLKLACKGYPISFLVNETNSKIKEIYKKAKIYWHASGFGEDLQKSPELSEHFGISTVEAMKAGCVPVVINAGGQTEIVKNGESGYLWETLDELEGLTMELINKDSLISNMSKAAKETSEKFNKVNFEKEVEFLIS